MAKEYKVRYDEYKDRRESIIIRLFGYSKIGADYNKLKIDINDPLLLKCNYNYYSADNYLINMNDIYAREMVANAVNDLPLFYQNPDAYIKISAICLSAIGVMITILFYVFRYVDLYFFYKLGKLFAVIALPLLIISIIGPIMFAKSIGEYRRSMRRCAMLICERYYTLNKERREKERFDAFLASRVYLEVCPNCGKPREGKEEHCTFCGSQLWQDGSEI